MEIELDAIQDLQMESEISQSNTGNYSCTPSSAIPESKIERRFNNFIAKLIMTERQNEIVYLLGEQLSRTRSDVDITFEQSVEENEVLFVYANQKGMNYIVIDSDGDIMISVSPVHGDGERIFQDYGEIDPEYSIFKLLSLT